MVYRRSASNLAHSLILNRQAGAASSVDTFARMDWTIGGMDDVDKH